MYELPSATSGSSPLEEPDRANRKLRRAQQQHQAPKRSAAGALTAPRSAAGARTTRRRFVTAAAVALTLLGVVPLAASAHLGSSDPTRVSPAASAGEIDGDRVALALGEPVNLRLDKVLTTAGPYLPGTPVSYTLTVTNDGPGTAQPGWTVTDLVPFALSVASAQLPGTVCQRNTDGSPTGTVLVCTGTNPLGPGDTATVTVTGTVADTAGPGDLIANVAYVTPAPGDDETNPLVEPDGNTDTGVTPTDNDGRAVLTVASAAFDLALVKVIDGGPALVTVGTEVPFRIVVRNQGRLAAAFTVTDALPVGMGLVPGSQSFDATPVDIVPLVTGRTLTWTAGAAEKLAPGAQVALTYKAKVTSVIGITEFRNRAEISGDNAASYGAAIHDEDSTPDANPDDDALIDRTSLNALDIDNDVADSDDHDVAVVLPGPPAVDLSLAKTVTPSAGVTVGSPVTFTLTVHNAATCGLAACGSASGVAVTDKLPSGFRYVSDTGAGAYDAASGVWTVPGAIAPGGDATLSITATVLAAGTLRNTAQVTAAAPADVDSTPDNAGGALPPEDDEAAVDLTVATPVGVSDLAVVGDIRPGTDATGNPYRYGDTVRLVVTLTNNGPDTATGVTVSCPLPAGLSYVGNDSDSGYDPVTALWTVGDLPVGASRTVVITAVVNPGGPWTHSPTLADHDQPDNSPANNSDADSIVPAPLSLGNRVWFDADNDGGQDADEPGLPGVPVRLLHPDGSVVRAAATSATGHYLFGDLAPGEYAVEITAPAGHVTSTGPRPPSVSEPAPDPDGNVDLDDNGSAAGAVIRSAAVTLRGGEPTGEKAAPSVVDTATDADSNLTVDFGLYLPASLAGVIWNDGDADGVRDPGEAPIANVILVVRDEIGTVVGQVVSAANGAYLVTGLTAGSYTVALDPATLPSGYVPTGDLDGMATPHLATATVAGGEDRTGADFGYRPSTTLAPPLAFVPTNPLTTTATTANTTATATTATTATAATTATTASPTVGPLARTGSNSAPLVRVAMLLVGAGLVLVGLTQLVRKRRGAR